MRCVCVSRACGSVGVWVCACVSASVCKGVGDGVCRMCVWRVNVGYGRMNVGAVCPTGLCIGVYWGA